MTDVQGWFLVVEVGVLAIVALLRLARVSGRLYDQRQFRRLSLEVKRVGDLVCWLCGAPGADTLDHVTPVSRGGTNDPANLRPAHRACNSERGNGRPAPPPRPPSRAW